MYVTFFNTFNIFFFALLPDDSFIHVLINHICFFLEIFLIETKTNIYLQGLLLKEKLSPEY